MDTLKTRRTVRSYADRDVEAALLRELLETAMRSSNTGNMQAYSVVVSRSEAVKQALAPLHFNQAQVTTAPVVLTFCADFNRFSKWCAQRKAEPSYGNVQSFVAAAIDAVILAQTFCVAAEAAGLGICYLGTTTYTAKGISEALRLPKLVLPVVTLSVGYPVEEAAAKPLSDRLPLDGILHEDQYRDYTPEDIDRIYEARESLEESRYFVELNKKETLAQIFTDIRYNKENNETFSVAFMDALRAQGFL